MQKHNLLDLAGKVETKKLAKMVTEKQYCSHLRDK
jgi:hypothetical protein